jgi:hypothetical protein
LSDFAARLGNDLEGALGERTRALAPIHCVPATEWLYELLDHFRVLLREPARLPPGAEAALRRAIRSVRI